MNQEELKQRLIELLIAGDISAQEQIITNYTEAISYIADFLVRKGVTIRERGEWKGIEEPTGVEAFGFREVEIYPQCSICGFDGDLSDWHSQYCPHCGADMRGGKE